MQENLKNFAANAIERYRKEIGSDHVICGLSGGVDSAVVAAILSKAVGRQLKCICVDSGLMRKNEIEGVTDAFTKHFDVELHVVDAAAGFLQRLAGVEDPEKKRLIIGAYFIDVFTETAAQFSSIKHLAQGTIYPDVVESAATKKHHNVGGLPEKLGFNLIEPLRELYKDDVRKLGIELGLPEDFVWRHPFPGPGLAVRCLGEVTREKLDRLRVADAIVLEEIRQSGLYRQVSQVFAVLLPVKSVGVTDGKGTYGNTVAIRCVATNDFMAADWVPLPTDVLQKMSARIMNEVEGINRVVYDISNKPPATIEWE
ncbi:MAG: glutamine-hydrolyzing GMP synthase [Planctomycetaceae bacterium]|nr:glutamine-hydrolyzing GMP synthase [Planctomycetaceae bacterium]